ncbi:MAG: CBS domain-containing protein [Pseudonocardiaceae bacterium]
MKVEGILTSKGRSVQTIQPWSTVAEAVRRLAGPPRIGALVITTADNSVAGMITERDIVRALGIHGAHLVDMQVAEVMSQHVQVCSPQHSITHLMMEMTRWRLRHLPVVEHGELVGIVSIGDVVRRRVEEMKLEVGVLRDLYIAKQ